MRSYIHKNEPNGSSSRNTLSVALEGCGQAIRLKYSIQLFDTVHKLFRGSASDKNNTRSSRGGIL